jgi:anti-sigma factor RsiW
MIRCINLVELVTDYLEGRLGFWMRAQLEWHLLFCPHCRAYLQQMKATVRALGRLPEVRLPADVEAELLRRFRARAV